MTKSMSISQEELSSDLLEVEFLFERPKNPSSERRPESFRGAVISDLEDERDFHMGSEVVTFGPNGPLRLEEKI
jgi:hypothetical protein